MQMAREELMPHDFVIASKACSTTNALVKVIQQHPKLYDMSYYDLGG
jgi:hypothetical protein